MRYRLTGWHTNEEGERLAPGTILKDKDLSKDERRRLKNKLVPLDEVKVKQEAAEEEQVEETGSDYDEMEKDELEALAAKRELEVEGSGSGGNVLKKDLVTALKAADETQEE